MRFLLVASLLVACAGTRPHPELVLQPGAELATVAENRRVSSRGAFVLTRGELASPYIYVRSAVVGPEGICWESATHSAAFWRAIRISTGATTRVVSGTPAELRTWLLAYVTSAAPGTHYSVRTTLGWRDQSMASLLAEALEQDAGGVLVGYRWAEAESVEYHRMLRGDSVSELDIDQAISDNDYFVRDAIENGVGLPPGPCPLAETGVPLLTGR